MRDRLEFQAKPPHFLSLGFITHDKPFFKPFNKIGGASAYSAILARNFGFDSAIVTSVGRDFEDFGALKGIRLAYQMGESTTTFCNKPLEEGVGGSGRRVQYVTSVAERIKEETIPEEWFNAEIVYVCPVLNEL